MRTALTLLVTALFVAATTLAGVPCLCDAAGHDDGAAEEPVSDCCGGSTEQVTEHADHDCPHCVSGQCDVLAAGGDASIDVFAAGASNAPYAPVSTVAVAGFEPASVRAVPPPRRPYEPPGAAHGQDTYARTQVIRC